MQKKRYTHGGYKPLTKNVEKYGDGNIDELEKNRPIFRGFVGGNAFVTKKGYRGMKIDSMWVQNIFESFKTDDEELAQIALQSQLADLSDVVVGGSEGSAFSIGDYGFYSKNVFEQQAKLLSADERKKSKASSYLSSMEWDTIDEKLSAIAHHGEARFLLAYRGDTFCALALRQNAFRVAKAFIDAGIDPLIENEEGHDIFEVVKQQYAFLGKQLKEVQDFKELARTTIMTPSVVQDMLDKEASVVVELGNLVVFAEAIKENLKQRQQAIANDKIIERRLQLRHMEVPPKIIWNIAQLSKVETYLQEITELKQYVEEKIRFHSLHAAEFDNLADLLAVNFDLILEDQQQLGRLLTSRPSDGRGSTDVAVVTRDSAGGSESSLRLPPIHPNSARSSNRPVTSLTAQLELGPIMEQSEGDHVDDSSAYMDQSSISGSRDGSGSTTRSAMERSGGIRGNSVSVFSDFNTPRSLRSSNGERSLFSETSLKSSRSPARLANKRELFERLGITKGVSMERGDRSASDSPLRSNNAQKTPTKLMEVKTSKDEYAPVIGTLAEDEYSTTMYR